jgi:hypothetical protein
MPGEAAEGRFRRLRPLSVIFVQRVALLERGLTKPIIASA